jgi:hypothetical protein
MKRVVVGCALVGLMAALIGGRAAFQSTSAQETATPVEASPAAVATIASLTFAELKLVLFAQAEIAVPADGSATLTASTLALPAGTETQTFVTEGTMVVSIQNGSVQLDADQVLIGVPDVASLIAVIPETPSPGPAQGTTLLRGQQAILQPGTRAKISNPSDQAASLVLITLAPLAPSVATPPA